MQKDTKFVAIKGSPRNIAEDTFAHNPTAVMLGQKCVAVAYSKTMGKRIANALNHHKPNSEGV